MAEVHTWVMQVSFPYLADPLPRAFAHRGWHLGELAGLENSLPAFRRAGGEGYRYLEKDGHATAGRVVGVDHDAHLDPTTERSGASAAEKWEPVEHVKVGGKAA